MKKIHIIVNPSSGTDYPILSILNRKLQGSGIDWDIFITKEIDDVQKMVKKAIRQKVDAVAVYGGDGSIVEAFQVLYKHETPLIVLPGGTANILAKELMISNIDQAIDLLVQKKYKKKKIDMGICNGKPFLLRVNFGFSADLVINANPTLKQKLGQVAYQLAAIQNLKNTDSSHYEIHIDGRIINTEGICLIVANSGNIGLPGISLLPEINITDGKLDVFLLKNADLSYLATVAKEAFFDRKKTTIDHWKGKKIMVKHIMPAQSVLLDDDTIKARTFEIRVVPKAVSVVMP